MDFDDPLADLSDGSNDSFFDEPKPAAKRSSLTKTPEKKSINDIFNITEKSSESVPKRSDDWLGLDPKSPSKSQKMTKKISFEDDDDILGTLGLSKKPPGKPETNLEETKPAKKLDLLESILGPSKSEEVEKKPNFDNISKPRSSLGASKNEEFVKKSSLDDILKESKLKSPGRPSTPADSLLFSEAPREGRRSRRPSSGLMDPLGLFSSEAKQEETVTTKEKREKVISKPVLSKSAPNISNQDLPDWLGGTPVKHSKSEQILPKPEEMKPEEIKPETFPELQKVEKVNVPPAIEDNQALTSFLTQQKLTHSHLEFQNTSIALQQQESQLLMALQLKKYEENLADMQMKQQEVLMKQEQQFNLLLEKQFAKQQIMENNMRLQQERINNHIQMLIAQPPVNKHVGQQEMDELKKSASEESVKMYESIISSLKQRQHEEVFLLEESYKKQISLLEQSLDSVEKRLKFDVEKMSEIFEDKLKSLQQQNGEEINKYKMKIQEMEEVHNEEIKQIRENNARMIEEIKYEHSTLLENIKDVKKSESSLFQESTSYLQKLDSNIEILHSNSRNLVELRDHIENDYGVLSKAREESLKAKEQEIIAMRTTLEKCRESAEKERAELLALVRTLETKISEQNQNAREERWAFQQAASTLAARSAAMDREAEFNRSAIEREREQLKTLKESILSEQEKMILHLTEEKLSLSAEKSRLETSSKLKTNFDSQKAKTEMEAAIQIAKEAAEMTDRERDSLQREKCEIEKLKRVLRDQEKKLVLREREVENLMKEAELRKNEGERCIFESKTIENKYNERLRELQSQLVTLSNREKKLAEEKIALSRERLALNTLARQSKNCCLCSADPDKLDQNYVSRFENVDTDIIRLRLEATDESSLNFDENVPK